MVYCIACCARSGSTYLAELCHSTGLLGIPREYINPDPMCGPQFRRKLGVAPDAPYGSYAEVLMAKRSTPNGVFGIKVVNYAENQEPLADFPIDHWLFLRRRDRLEQAISLYKAMANEQWVWREGEARPSPPFDAGEIRSVERYLDRKHSEWLKFFDNQSIEPLELWYEEIQRDPQDAIMQVCEFVGVSADTLPPLQATTKVQRDEVTQQWKQRLREERIRSSSGDVSGAEHTDDGN